MPRLIAILIDFWSRKASKIGPKSIKNRSKIRCYFRYRFQIDLWSNSGGSKPWKWCFRIDEVLFFIKSLFPKSHSKIIIFWSKKPPKINQKSIKNHIKNYIKKYIDVLSIFENYICFGRTTFFSEFDFEGIGMSGEVPRVVWKVWEAGIIYLLRENWNLYCEYGHDISWNSWTKVKMAWNRSIVVQIWWDQVQKSRRHLK